VQDLCDAAHPGTADTHEMNVLDCVFHDGLTSLSISSATFAAA
jgi:hypothetical protein